jgi:hypothetical protein
MTCIYLSTLIKADIKTCFDVSRSVDLHLHSMAHTHERVVDGRTRGFFELGEVVTWEACHFGIKQQLTVKITQLRPYSFFEDCMLKGAFKSMRHQHFFEEKEGKTEMRDVFCYETPYGFLGKLVDILILRKYMKDLLEERNKHIQQVAEQT